MKCVNSFVKKKRYKKRKKENNKKDFIRSCENIMSPSNILKSIKINKYLFIFIIFLII